MWFNGYCLQFFFLGKWVDFQNYFYFSTELQNLVNTYIPCISEFPWVWLRHHTGRCRCWLSSYFLNLCPMSIANCTKNYSRAYFIYNFCTLWLWATYISHFIESPILFGLYTYRYIPQQQKNKIPKGGEKDLPGWCQWTQTGTSELGTRGGGQFYIWAEIEAKHVPCSFYYSLPLPPDFPTFQRPWLKLFLDYQTEPSEPWGKSLSPNIDKNRRKTFFFIFYITFCYLACPTQIFRPPTVLPETIPRLEIWGF